MKTLGLILLIGISLFVAFLLGVASDLFGPLGKTLLIVAVVLLLTVIGFRIADGNAEETSVFSRRAGESTGGSLRDTLGINWFDSVENEQQMARHISLEINRSRRYGRSFTVLVISPKRGSLIEGGIDTREALIGVRLFIQETAVKILRSTDIIGNSTDPASTLAMLPETDTFGAGVALDRFKRSISDSDLTLGAGRNIELSVSVKAISYPTDVTDVTGLYDLIAEFENNSGNRSSV